MRNKTKANNGYLKDLTTILNVSIIVSLLMILFINLKQTQSKINTLHEIQTYTELQYAFSYPKKVVIAREHGGGLTVEFTGIQILLSAVCDQAIHVELKQTYDYFIRRE